MNRIATLIFIGALLLLGTSALAQKMEVESFRLAENSISANIEGPNKRIDQNGEVAALIKVRTTETGFRFDGGLLGIVDTRQDVGEIYVWVPRAAKKLQIKHQKFGVLDYWYGMPIGSGRTYEMVLKTEYAPVRRDMEYLIMTISPADADVYIDDTLRSTLEGRVKERLLVGKHRYSVSHRDYIAREDTFEILPETLTEFDVVLTPRKGEVLITSNVDNAMVYVDGLFKGFVPYTFEAVAGEYRVTTSANGYKDRTKRVTLYSGVSNDKMKYRLTPAYVPDNKWIWHMTTYSIYPQGSISEIGTSLTYLRSVSSYFYLGAGIAINWNWKKHTPHELVGVEIYASEYESSYGGNSVTYYGSEYEYRASRLSVPLYAMVRLYPAGSNKKTKPFFDTRLGISLCKDYLVQKDIYREGTFKGAFNTGFYLSPSFGIERPWFGIGKTAWELSIAYERNGLINMKTPYYYEGLDTYEKLNRAISFRFGFVF